MAASMTAPPGDEAIKARVVFQPRQATPAHGFAVHEGITWLMPNIFYPPFAAVQSRQQQPD